MPMSDLLEFLGNMKEHAFLIVSDQYDDSPDLMKYGYSLQTVKDNYIKAISIYCDILQFENAAPDSKLHIGLAFTIAEATQLIKHVPTYLVVSWPYNKLPSEIDDFIQAKHPQKIALLTPSHHIAKELVTDSENCKVIALPPLSFAAQPNLANTDEMTAVKQAVELDFNTYIIDSKEFDPTTSLFHLNKFSDIHPEHGPALLEWDGQKVELGFTSHDYSGMFMQGFYAPEPWGCWSLTGNPSINLPYVFTGNILLHVEAQGYGNNIDREITVYFGAQQAIFSPSDRLEQYTFAFSLNSPKNKLTFSGIELEPLANAQDTRTMGIGISRIIVCKNDPFKTDSSMVTTGEIPDIDGVIYTAVLPSTANEANWKDLITGFCSAFKHCNEANLIIHFTNGAELSDVMLLMSVIQRSTPMLCRVIILTGDLSPDDTNKLISITSFYVNVAQLQSTFETEASFMLAGKPVIAPRHSCLQDLLDNENSIPITTSLEPEKFILADSSNYFQLKHRLNWESLATAFVTSLSIAKSNRQYCKMAKAARNKTEKIYSSSANEYQIKKLISPAQSPLLDI
jgi:hypothetical protein